MSTVSPHLYPFTAPADAAARPPKVFVEGDGCRVRDNEGRWYLDGAAALWCASLGFSEQRLIDAATRQMEQLPYYHSFMGRTPESTERLADRLTARLPGPIGSVFFGSSGSEAVETAVKIARYVQIGRGRPQKQLVIAREDAYHGSGSMSAALTAMDYCHDGFALPNDAVLRAGSSHYAQHARPGESEADFSARRADELDQMIDEAGPHRVCAMIAEPAIGSGGAIPPPEGYWAAVQAVLRKHDVLLIADEIVTGFGRTGQWFGCETFDIQPDLVTMAKALTAAYFPLSAVGIHERVTSDLAAHADRLGTFGHGFTYSGHPVGAAVALAAMDIYEELDLPSFVQERAGWLAAALAPFVDDPAVIEVRQTGLMAGVECRLPGAAAGASGRAIGRAAEERGVLFRVIGDTLAISPPLIIDRGEIDELATVLGESIAAASTGDSP